MNTVTQIKCPYCEQEETTPQPLFAHINREHPGGLTAKLMLDFYEQFEAGKS